MSYRVFALKYRPATFDEVIGQEHVIVSLRNAITSKRLHHAYLFSGPRGVGKTSLARILAKALNCQSVSEPTVRPCGKCESCKSITAGTSMDVIEIDGASNRGIDEIRSLREAVKLVPASSRFKVYIIDEVHMLTQEAFNALLKTLEEPPSHVKFIFATTHPQKVLPTILSRCQKFQFTLLAVERIEAKLAAIVKSEKLKINKDLLYAIARSSDGSIRDAESLLDQLVPIVLEEGDVKDVLSFLGIIDEHTLHTMCTYLLDKDLEASLEFIQKTSENGKDLGLFLNSLIGHLRCVLIAKVSPKAFKHIRSLSPSTKESIGQLAKRIAPAEILTCIDLFIEAKDISKKLNSVRVPFELAVIKFASQGTGIGHVVPSAPPKEQPLSATRGKAAGASQLAGESGPDREPQPKRQKSDTATPKKTEKQTDEKEPPSFDELTRLWPQLIANIRKARASLAAYLQEASLTALQGGIATLAFEKRFSLHKEIVESAKNTAHICEAFEKLSGKRLGIKCTLIENIHLAQQKKSESPPQAHAEADNDFINELLDTFEGNIHTDID